MTLSGQQMLGIQVVPIYYLNKTEGYFLKLSTNAGDTQRTF